MHHATLAASSDRANCAHRAPGFRVVSGHDALELIARHPREVDRPSGRGDGPVRRRASRPGVRDRNGCERVAWRFPSACRQMVALDRQAAHRSAV